MVIYYWQIYLVAENKVLKIYPLMIGTNEAPVQVFFESADQIIGISASLSSSLVLINVKNRGLFAFRLYGQLIWSAGPVLYQHGFRQGCRKNATECYFISAPAIDHCEATVFVRLLCFLILFCAFLKQLLHLHRRKMLVFLYCFGRYLIR